MKSKLVLIMTMFISLFAGAQKGTVKMKTYAVSGNCGMCRKTIEKAASIRGVKEATWDQNRKILSLRFDSMKVTAAEVLRQVAYAGYDNEHYLAPEQAYNSLPECCRYERKDKKQSEGHHH